MWQEAGRNPALPVHCQSKASMGSMPRVLGPCCRVGMLLPRAFPMQVGAGCILPSKLLHSPSSVGMAHCQRRKQVHAQKHKTSP